MIIKGLIDEDFVNYKKPSMFIAFPYCSFKCEKECGIACCQNSELISQPNIKINISDLVERYLTNPITKAIVCGGLEPFDSYDDLYNLIDEIRSRSCNDPIIIYTGYNKTEIENKIFELKAFKNIIVKFGRFIPNKEHHKDDVLGIELASPNQYAEVL